MYSQNNEEQIILDYFFPAGQMLTDGRFNIGILDIGANDGKTLSNSLALIESCQAVHFPNYKAVLVEPSPTAFAKLKALHANRPNVYCIEKAVGPKNCKAVLWDSGTHLNQGDTSLVSTIKEAEKDRWKTENFTPVEVDCVDFETLLTLSPIKQFDFITVDIEGLEKDVLPQMNLGSLGCKLLCVEWNGRDFDFFNNYCIGFGMKLLHQNAENLIYAL